MAASAIPVVTDIHPQSYVGGFQFNNGRSYVSAVIPSFIPSFAPIPVAIPNLKTAHLLPRQSGSPPCVHDRQLGRELG